MTKAEEKYLFQTSRMKYSHVKVKGIVSLSKSMNI